MNILHIKNMVCPRCIMAVEKELQNLEIDFTDIKLGEVTLKYQLEEQKLEDLKIALENLGFELLNNRKSKMIAQIKSELINLVHNDKDGVYIDSLSSYLSKTIGADYSYLSNLFSSVEGITIEKYFILQKVEKVKELLSYDELSISEISYHLGYSSGQHLSSQFKKITGMTPSQFKNLKDKNRDSLDEI